jgi:ketosteroid isomerase-like protein/quercetin dioxygenase-like cupin family protein
MRTYVLTVATVIVALSGCTPAVDVEQERAALAKTDSDWAAAAADPDKFASFYAPGASFYAAGMPVVKGQPAIREVLKQLAATPGFDLKVTTSNTEVGAAGDVGYTTGMYTLATAAGVEKGKSVTVWRKQSDGNWRVVEDIFNADTAPSPVPGPHTLLAPSSVVWGEAPPSLPPGARLAVIAGDPSQPGPFVVRVEMPAGYTIAPHWHPTDEHVTVLSGAFALGMGDTLDAAAMQDLPAGGFALMPARMHHYAMAKTDSIVQVHGMGPLAVNYVNAADDPSRATK